MFISPEEKKDLLTGIAVIAVLGLLVWALLP